MTGGDNETRHAGHAASRPSFPTTNKQQQAYSVGRHQAVPPAAMSAHAGRIAASRRPIVGFESDVEASTSSARAPRIHPALYAFALLSAGILLVLSIAALEGYTPPVHLPNHHDELFSSKHADQHHGHSQLVSDAPPGQNTGKSNQVSTSWNNIASVLGGFSTTYVTSPQLNTSWIARPAGFGGRITDGQGLVGKLEYMKLSDEASSTKKGSNIDRTGCQTGQPIASHPDGKSGLPRVALILRGECQFITKLLNAQAQGFDAAIVYNDYDHARRANPDRDDDHLGFGGSDEDELISMWSPSRQSAFLHIPSVFVSYLTGKTLETLLAVEGDNLEDAIVILEPEDSPHFLLMDIVIALFFLPTIFTTVVLVVTRLRQIQHRAQQRAPQTLVDSLPTFQWREGLDLNLEALAIEEKGSDPAASAGPDGGRAKSAGMDHRLADFLSRALRRPAPPGNGVSARHVVIPVRKARQIAKKIFQQKECVICISDFVHGDTVRLLPCGHLFHKDEIDSWLVEQKRWCPVCRFPVDGEDEEAAVQSPSVEEEGRAGSPLHPTAISIAQPIIMPDDIAGSTWEDEQPVASSSTASERTPLLSTLSRSSDKS